MTVKQTRRHDSSGRSILNRKEAQSLPVIKRMFPFRLGATSCIVPAAIIPNIRFLGPYVDEVELVLFESKGENSLPSPAEIEEMQFPARQIHRPANLLPLRRLTCTLRNSWTMHPFSGLPKFFP
jgi:hypothetical protein